MAADWETMVEYQRKSKGNYNASRSGCFFIPIKQQCTL